MTNTNEIVCGEVKVGTAAYAATLALREEILRKPLGIAFSPKDLPKEDESFHLACWRGGRVIACVVLEPVDNRQVRLRQMAVAQQHQRTGVGTRLIEFAEAFLIERGYRHVVLHARETAVPFYERLGYQKEGDRFTEVTIPHFSMQKELGRG